MLGKIVNEIKKWLIMELMQILQRRLVWSN